MTDAERQKHEAMVARVQARSQQSALSKAVARGDKRRSTPIMDNTEEYLRKQLHLPGI